jgi:hypothetical protein
MNEMPIQEFEARDDCGRAYQIIVFQAVASAATRANPAATAPGLKRMTTSRGQTVRYVQQGEYQLVETGETLWSDDPKAP